MMRAPSTLAKRTTTQAAPARASAPPRSTTRMRNLGENVAVGVVTSALTLAVKTMWDNAWTTDKKVEDLKAKFRDTDKDTALALQELGHQVKTLDQNVKTLDQNVKTLVQDLKTLNQDLKTLNQDLKLGFGEVKAQLQAMQKQP